MGPGYAGELSRSGRPTIVANETTVGPLVAGQVTYVVARAFDRSPAHNEEQNHVVLAGIRGLDTRLVNCGSFESK